MNLSCPFNNLLFIVSNKLPYNKSIETRGEIMSLSIILIVVVTIMSIFAIAIFIIAKKSNFTTKQTIDPKPQQTFKSSQQDIQG